MDHGDWENTIVVLQKTLKPELQALRFSPQFYQKPELSSVLVFLSFSL